MDRRRKRRAPGWVGIDVSKDVFDVAIWGDQAFSAMTLAQFKRTKKGAEAFARWLASQTRKPAGIVMEWTGGYSRELAEWLHQLVEGTPVALMNPCLVKAYGKSLNLRNKTDAVDARLLAAFGQERKPSGWVPPTPELDQLQSLFRTRAKLMEMLSALKTRDESCLDLAPEAEKAQTEVIQLLTAKVKALVSAAETLATQHPAMAADMKLLRSIKGVGPITAMAVMAEAGDLRRFRRSRQLTAFLGVSPRRYESGSSVRGKTRMCRIGGTHVRPVLYMAAVSVATRKCPLGEFYRRLVAAGKPEMVAIGAVMRKMVLMMRAVLIRNKPFEVMAQGPQQGVGRPARPEGESKGPGGGHDPGRDRGRLKDGQASARQEDGAPKKQRRVPLDNP